MINTLVPYFGAARMIAESVGEALAGCSWVGVPFAGGMSELQFIAARTIHVSDLHREVINLAMCVAQDSRQLCRDLSRLPFHPDVLEAAQERLDVARRVKPALPDFQLARDYFVCSWMSRSGLSGTKQETTGGLPIRWNAGGGDSAVRYRSAVKSLAAWSRIMKRCTFDVQDAFAFLARCEDTAGHGVYCDPPFFDAGKKYLFNCGSKPDEQRHWHFILREELSRFSKTRVVMRAYDHPVIAELYPEETWRWTRLKGRKQTNEEAPEVLISNE